MTEFLPEHLKKYIVTQNYEKYTSADQAVWRYILRQLKFYLSTHAHESYLDGLEKTGINIEKIPRIEDVSAKLEEFGWKALPVSGFIPPAAFMELQSIGVLPIASDMRSIDHLLYTPAPDIVHEAAGHAPILANKEYAEYLKQYAQVAKKAILSKQDLDLYKAIRELSDIKENPNSTSDEIQIAENNLKAVTQKITFTSEASELARMNWWTAEYGLIGDIKSPKIFGAGLLSSVGESKWCMSDQVKKIPLSIDCVKQSYDITEPQPQLFVAESFKHLSQVLNDFSKTMAYNVGGTKSLDKIIQAETVNTVELNNGFQISGVLKKYHLDSENKISYLQFSGPTQLCHNYKQIEGHSRSYHADGFGTPLGEILDFNLDKIKPKTEIILNYKSGVHIKGFVQKITPVTKDAVILSLSSANCVYQNNRLFSAEWGIYDILLSQTVKTVFGGPADRAAYGEMDDFVAPRVQAPVYSEYQNQIFSAYETIRHIRSLQEQFETECKSIFVKYVQKYPQEWLLFIELAEIGYKSNFSSAFLEAIEKHLEQISKQNPVVSQLIFEGLRLAHAKY